MRRGIVRFAIRHGGEGPRLVAVIGHYDAGYTEVGRKLGLAVFDIGDRWNTLGAAARMRENQAFLDDVIRQGLALKVVTKGVVRRDSCSSGN